MDVWGVGVCVGGGWCLCVGGCVYVCGGEWVGVSVCTCGMWYGGV